MINRIQDGAGVNHGLAIPYAVTGGTSTAITATIDGVTLTEGAMIALYFSAANGASATLNVNELGAKPLYYNGAAISSGIIPKKNTVIAVYGTSVVSTGAWSLVYSYNSNSDSKTTSGNSTEKIFLVGATTQSTSGQTTYSNSNVFTQSGELHAPKMVVTTDSYGSTLPTTGVEGQIYYVPVKS